jgi:hypothetical protein
MMIKLIRIIKQEEYTKITHNMFTGFSYPSDKVFENFTCIFLKNISAATEKT